MESGTSKQSLIVKSYTVPMDVFLDILRIFLNNETDYHIEGINERENSLLIQVKSERSNTRQKNVRENITMILAEYGYYLHGKPGDSMEYVED
jgi:hypothetical protein